MLVDKYPWLLEPTLLTTVIRTLMAVVCGGIIGLDRDVHGAPAGLRTHILVCVGAMLAMTTGQFASIYLGDADPTRIGAQVISGIGFLGAGTIIVIRYNKISGLTTAAGLWASACLGLAIGVGYYEGAIIGCIAIFFTEHMLMGLSESLKTKNETYEAKYSDPDSNPHSGPDAGSILPHEEVDHKKD